MGIRALCVSAAMMALTTGCYFETLDQREARPGEPALTGPQTKKGLKGTCRSDFNTGCFDGYVSVMQEFDVDGETFFDPNDLATNFHKLVTVDGADGEPLVAGEDYQLQLTTPLDNASFFEGFSYDLKGDYSRHDDVRQGNFSINNLPEGSYTLRVMRPIKFNITRTVAGEPVDGQPTTVIETHGRCATLYYDTVLDVERGERLSATFNSFSMHMSDSQCSAEGTGTTVTLP